jgi:sigma-B regulation protein RsbU (phosphoserine phosphatase)
MNKKKGLSLRYKILLMLTFLPLIMLGIYLFVVINVFKSDKLAYVYDSTSAVSKTLASQVSSELNALLSSTKPIIQEYVLKKSFGQISYGVISPEGPIQWIAVYSSAKSNPSEIEQVGLIEREGMNSETIISKTPDFANTVKSTKEKNRIVLVPFQDENTFLFEKVNVSGTDQSLIFVIYAKLNNLMTTFRNPESTENYFVASSGEILFGPQGKAGTWLQERTSGEFLNHILEQKFNAGAEGFKSVSGEELLAGYAKLAFGETFVVSLVSQAEALKAVKVLIIRSIIFMMVLVSVTVIVSLFASGNLTSALLDLFSATKKVAEGNFEIQVQVNSNDEVGDLADSFNVMAKEVSRLMEQTAEKARMETELKTAQTVQETLFPPTQADFGVCKISGFYEPASECGGDWWHYCDIGGRLFMWIGDATGHGVPAALITSAAKSASVIIERLNLEPKDAMTLLNRAIYDVSKGKIMMTFSLLAFDPTINKIIYANASHEAPFLIKKSEKPLKKKDLIPLNDIVSPRLGHSRDTIYEQCELDIEPGDRIFFFTDGIPDIQNLKNEPLGEREFIKKILACCNENPTAQMAVEKLVFDLMDYRQATPLKDDVTLFMFEYTDQSDEKKNFVDEMSQNVESGGMNEQV